MNTYVLLNEYIPEIKFKGKLLNSDVVTVGETVTFAENISGYPKYFFDKRDNKNKDCAVEADIDTPANISYVTLSGYDPLASDEDNLPYVALRVANGCNAVPDSNGYGTPINTNMPDC